MGTRWKAAQIVHILNEQAQGRKVTDICRKHGIATSTFYRWKAQYGRMNALEAQKLQSLEQENRKLKRLVADLSLDKAILQDLLASQRKEPTP